MSINPSESPRSQQQKLRTELKEWEKAFASTNAGRKAGREDIKREPEIAAKYKAYNKLRTKTLSRNPFESQQSSSPPPAKTRRHFDASQSRAKSRASTSQRQHEDAQPEQPHHPSTLDPYDLPSAHSTPSSLRTRQFVGPTPQKDGQVLGLFDLLSPASAKKKFQQQFTPSKKASFNPTTFDATADVLSDVSISVAPVASTSKPIQPSSLPLFSTPSKTRTTAPVNTYLQPDLSTTPLPHRHIRTPQSSGKRKFLDAFLTPSTRRANALSAYVLGDGPEEKTPSSRGKRSAPSLQDPTITSIRSRDLLAPSQAAALPLSELDATPAFLRRFTAPVAQPLKHGNESLLGVDIPAPRLPRRKPLGRSLSEMIRSVREEEDERLDEEAEIMRELEMEEEDEAPPKRPKILVRDSQARIVRPSGEAGTGKEIAGGSAGNEGEKEKEMRLGADGEWDSEDEEEPVEDGHDKNGGDGRKWKKKGQKRTTRRAKMKPRTEKWVPEKEWTVDQVEDKNVEAEAEKERGDEVVGETQANDTIDGDHIIIDDGSDAYENTAQSEDEEDDDKQSRGTRKRGRPKSQATKIPEKNSSKGKTKVKEKAEEKEKKNPRKVSATAHANFRALKIRNKNSRGRGGGRGGRFGRRR